MRRVLQAFEQKAITATKAEVDLLISDVSNSIQEYIEDNSNLTGLKRSIDELKIASSTLKMMQIHGGVLLIDETVKVIQMLVDGNAARVEEAQNVVSQSIIRLAEYLAHVEAGNRDVPLALMPLLNDLRAAQGVALLSENVLFFPNIDVVSAPEIFIETKESADESWLRLIRANFQKTLLACVTGNNIPTAAAQLCKLTIRLQRASKTEACQKLWWLASALAQAVAINAIEFNVSIASLFSGLDKQIKILIEQGEEKFSKAINENIVKNILYYIAISDSRGRIVNQVKDIYKLNEQIPQQKDIEEVRQQISAPSNEVLITVSKALLEDIAAAKDCIELFIHSNLEQQSHINRLCSELQKISDTLSMIGIQEYKTKAEHQIHEVELLKSGEQPDAELVLLDVSEVILEIETCINNFIDYRINFNEFNRDGPGEDQQLPIHQQDNEHRAAFSVTITEVLLRIEQAKEVLTDVIHDQYDKDKVQQCVQNIREICGVVNVIDITVPIELIDGIANYIDSDQFKQDVSSESNTLRDLADCVISLQCYFEQLDARVPYAEQIIKHCESALEHISQVEINQNNVANLDINNEDSEHDPNVDHDLNMTMMQSMDDMSLTMSPAENEASQNSMSNLDENEIDMLPDLNDINEQSSELSSQSEGQDLNDMDHLQIDPVVSMEINKNGDEDFPENEKNSGNEDGHAKLVVLTGDADPIMVETFIEEAEQVVKDIRNFWNAWRDDENDWNSFAEMRRGYHTLKGSGRFVGAELLAEHGWQLENLCNKLLGKKESLDESKQTLLQKGVENAYKLVQQLRNPEQKHDIDAYELIEQLKNCANSFDNNATSTPLTNDKLRQRQETISESLQVELTGIFAVEASGHLKSMREALGEEGKQHAAMRIDENLLRAIHTMRGSASTAGIKHISDLCEPLEEIIRLAITREIKFDNEQTHLIQKSIKQIETDLHKIEASGSIDEPDDILVKQLCALRNIFSNEYIENVDKLENETEQKVDLSKQSASMQVIPEMVDYAHDRDEELCEIFYEEAEDLLLECQSSFQKLKIADSIGNVVSELQRQFHTLKGSSRMAGLTTIGELSHVTETLLIAIDNGSVEKIKAIELLQKVLDTLHSDIERVHANEDISLNCDLVGELRLVSDITRQGASKCNEALNHPLADNKTAEPNGNDLVDGGSRKEEKQLDIVEPELDNNLDLDEPEDIKQNQIDESTRQTSRQYSEQVGIELKDAEEMLKTEKHEIDNTPALKKFIKVPNENHGVNEKQEVVRVQSDILDGLVNDAGELNIQRSRLEQVFTSFTSSTVEFEQTIGRLRDQLRKLEIETEAQILFKHADDQANAADFDPLELDRYSDIQQLSRSLAESVDDLSNIREMFLKNIQNAEDVLVDQKVVTTNLQDNLLSTRMIRFDTLEARLQRIIRQTASELDKQVDLIVEGGDIEIDRRVLNGVTTSIEHILRNSVNHGIESIEKREALGKPRRGQIKIEIEPEGSEISITIKDDGAGIDSQKVKDKAIENGLIKADAELSDEDALHLIFKPGLSTAGEVSKIAGRGVGMDIVEKDIRGMGGNIETRSVSSKGAKFILKLPFTLAVSHALLVKAGKEVYALTLSGVEGVVQLPASELKDIFSQNAPVYSYAGYDYSFHHLASLLKTDSLYYEDENIIYPVILVKLGDQRFALQVDATFGNKEIVVKPLAPHFSQAQGISGATILGDGNVALILDIPWIVRLIHTHADDAVVVSEAPKVGGGEEVTVMVVDDSITIRKVTTRFLERNNYKVVTAKDGVDALQKLQKTVPNVLLLDIEMPRMDGYELATQIRKEARLADIPIIMITSRTGHKHKSRALDIGVDCYLGKPYNEVQLLESIQEYK